MFEIGPLDGGEAPGNVTGNPDGQSTGEAAMMHCDPPHWERGNRCNPVSKASRAETSAYRVGEPLRQGRRDWPEGAQLVFGPGGPELTIFHREIDDDLVEDIRRGPAEFALIVEPPVIVLAYRFGESSPWNDVPYSWHLQPEPKRVIPHEIRSAEERALIWISLVGAADGIIHAQRGMTLSPAFTRSLHEAIRAQTTVPFDPIGCTDAIKSLYLGKKSDGDTSKKPITRSLGNV